MTESDDSIGRVIFLKRNLQAVLVGHRAAGGQEAMLKLAAGFVGQIHQQIAQLVALRVLLQVALHHRIRDRRVDRGFHQQRMAVPVAMHADARDHIQFHAAVGQFHERSVPDPAGEIVKEEAAVTEAAEFLQHRLIGLFEFGARRTH